MVFMVLALMPFLVHCSKLICLTYSSLRIRVRAEIRTLFTETAHPAVWTRAGIRSLADTAILAREPADSWKHHDSITNSGH